MSLDLENGSNQYADWTPDANFQSLAGATLTMWIRPESSVFCCSLQFAIGSGPIDNVRVGMLHTGAGVPSLRARRLDGDSATSCNGAALTPGGTYFLAGVVDYTGSRMDLYIASPGSSISGAAASVTGIAGWGSACSATTPQNASIGALGDHAAGEQFDGLIQDARVYLSALTLADVQGVYMGYGPTPRAWWKMDAISGTATTVGDTMGNHNATATNSPVYAGNIFYPTPARIAGGDYFRRRV